MCEGANVRVAIDLSYDDLMNDKVKMVQCVVDGVLSMGEQTNKTYLCILSVQIPWEVRETRDDMK